MDSNRIRVIGITGQANSGKDTVANYFIQNHNFVQVALADPLKRLGKKVFEFTEQQLWGPSHFRNELDSRYKYYDKNRGSDAMWAKAAHNLGLHGRTWIKGILNDKTKQEQTEAHAELIKWFNWLGHNYPQLSPRIMLQTLGTEWGREAVDTDVWVSHMLQIGQVLEASYPDATYVRTSGIKPKENSRHTGIVVSDVRFNNELKAIRDYGGELIKVKRSVTDSDADNTGIAKHRSETEQKGFDTSIFNLVIHNDSTLADLEKQIDYYVQG